MSEELFERTVEIETGRLAKQANGAVLFRYADTVVLATVAAAREAIEGEDFLPLTVNYQEKSYAAGRIPGGYFKREGRPSEKEILTSRLIDRPIRPLFPKKYTYPTQVIVTVMSTDQENDPDVLSITAASAALMVSNIPFAGPVAGVRVGRIDGQLVCNPTKSQIEDSDIDLVVAGTEEAIVMVESGSKEVSEDEMIDALMFAHDCIKKFIEPQKKLISEMDSAKIELPEEEDNSDLYNEITEFSKDKLKEAILTKEKQQRASNVNQVYDDTIAHFTEKYPETDVLITKLFDDLKRNVLRLMVVDDKKRIDGRSFTDIRDISIETGFLPRTHGSALFTRGETQAAVIATLGTSYDEQKIDSLEGDTKKSFILHYNFPPFSVGEVGNRLGPGRREIGHGALAERAIRYVVPSKEDFPYTVRVVSDILESNGSSSMATVCGTSLSLMDAGVPVKDHVAGVAMGLIKEEDKVAILTDILGDEDHLGDMDFKVAGTEKGITALQMDIKITGVTREILETALTQAKDARMFILGKMKKAITGPRENISEYAPMITSIKVDPAKIKDIIGSGGKTIKKIVEESGAQIDIQDDGTVNVAAVVKADSDKAIKMIEMLTEEIEVGQLYIGVAKRILDFGAVVELASGKDGLVHISELAPERVKEVTDIINEGDEVLVKCIEKGRDGKIRLSRKAALDENIEDYR
ncbi:MAG: polyribonucleotide nucleotidyltransferase [Candidatus Dadabacteria bacterium]|nr:polyribonucleotide nucleotidyltransferase [Candidatus Dadabacteria bacterium]NIS09745.1 polyribonucleotide nucleotidyltransferase [Candidatus Dadabacteria bacterium]NIV41110.1 polyribonucleotide nucleotidyltransferase [Candidatus Dadabacteria bacterium]NIX16203.1 polyribonucleotide nucleotidyltransferase [Candidatus Dadabacteria bacterium]NIY22826.1 polyribonucleotide nucleotidyltransferase [Candidatus Dadabacteria bacterium]